jgi:hypothetical protein
LARVNAQVNHGADEHVAADAAENVEIECFQEGWSGGEDANSLI